MNDAQPGDLLFIKEPGLVYNPDGSAGYPNGQGGFSHVAFCQTAGGIATGTDFGANWYPNLIQTTQIGAFKSFYGSPFNLALDMSQVR